MHNGVLFNHKEQWNFVLCRKMDGIRDHDVSEISQSHQDKYHMFLS
jgi:hypothetical protein